MRSLLTLLAIATILAGCGSIKPYRVTVTQGNLILEKMSDRLRLGMTPEQVIHVLGPPMAETPLQPDHWSYVYSVERGGQVLYGYNVTLRFEDGKLAQVDGLKKFAEGGADGDGTGVISDAAATSALIGEDVPEQGDAEAADADADLDTDTGGDSSE